MIYSAQKSFNVPSIDLLTLIFESPLTWLKENDTAHVEAAHPENRITKAELRMITKRLIHLLRHRYGIGATGSGKDVVLCMSSGQVLLPSIFFGVIGAGGIISAASPALTVEELARQIRQGPSNLLVLSEDCKEVGIQAARQCGISLERVLVLHSTNGKREMFDAAGNDTNYLLEIAELEWERVTDPRVLEDRPICLLYSSGTTGPPKGVHISHCNVVYEGVVPQLLYREYFSRRQQEDPKYKFESRTIAHLPAAHIAGCQGYFINPAVAGGTVYWMPKFDFPKFLEYSKRFAVTFFFTVPPIWLLIAKSPLVTDHFKTLELAITGAAPIGPELKAMAEKNIGCGRIGQTWGLSETTGSATLAPWEYHDNTGGISPLMPNCQLRIVDDNENDMADGEEGEFIIRGPAVTKGYWRNEKATKESFTKDGQWFKTGDVGVHKNGKFYIVDRKKELIKYKGLQVAPAELEAHLLSNSQILDAAVIGVPDPDGSGNELPRAYVVVAAAAAATASTGKDSRASLSQEDIQRFVKDHLASYKQLRGGVVYLDAIPKSPSGKILRRVLRDMAKQEVEQVRRTKAKL